MHTSKAQEGVLKMTKNEKLARKNILELDENEEAIYPEMSDAQARDVYNDIAIYLDGYIYPWIE